MVETFFKIIKAELIQCTRWETRRQVGGAILQYINGFYNPRRWHSSLGGKSHLAIERKAAFKLRDRDVSEAITERLCHTYMIDIGHRIAIKFNAIYTYPRVIIKTRFC